MGDGEIERDGNGDRKRSLGYCFGGEGNGVEGGSQSRDGVMLREKSQRGKERTQMNKRILEKSFARKSSGNGVWKTLWQTRPPALSGCPRTAWSSDFLREKNPGPNTLLQAAEQGRILLVKNEEEVWSTSGHFREAKQLKKIQDGAFILFTLFFFLTPW